MSAPPDDDGDRDRDDDIGGRDDDEQTAGSDAEIAGLDRRTLIRLLVGLGIGIPVLIEGATFLGLLSERLGGDGDDDADGAQESATPTGRRVGVGDELLPETSPTETVEVAYVGSDGWTLTVSVAVENTTDRTYELRLRSVTTADGRTVEGGGESGPIPPGETGSVTGRWDLPEGSSPARMDVFAIARNGTATRTERTVELGRIPVRGDG